MWERDDKVVLLLHVHVAMNLREFFISGGVIAEVPIEESIGLSGTSNKMIRAARNHNSNIVIDEVRDYFINT